MIGDKKYFQIDTHGKVLTQALAPGPFPAWGTAWVRGTVRYVLRMRYIFITERYDAVGVMGDSQYVFLRIHGNKDGSLNSWWHVPVQPYELWFACHGLSTLHRGLKPPTVIGVTACYPKRVAQSYATKNFRVAGRWDSETLVLVDLTARVAVVHELEPYKIEAPPPG